jgi:hypothetical protein
MYEESIVGKIASNLPAKLGELMGLFKQESDLQGRDLDDVILKEFPLNGFGDANEPLYILGSKQVLDQFMKIDNQKFDVVDKLENIYIEDVAHNKQLVIKFKEDSLTASGIYRFTYEFLDLAFNMGKFSTYCLENNLEQLLVKTVRELCESPKRYQFRMILDDNKNWLLRGITSVRYNNYDNHLALYLTLLALHKHAKSTHRHYALDKAYISDSEIVVMFDSISPTTIYGVGNLYVGLILTNSEIKEKNFSLEYRFRLEDEEGNEFDAIPEGEEPIFKIRHDSNIESVKEQLKSLDDLEVFKKRIVNLVYDIAESPFLSENKIFELFKKIISSRNKYSPETKQAFKKLQEEKIINNSLHIIKAFNRMNELVADVEEKIYLERLFFDVCLAMKKGNRKKN